METSFTHIECPECHTKHVLYDAQETEYYGCGNCHQLLYLADDIPKNTQQLHKKKPTATPVFPLGCKGVLHDRELRVLAFAQRREADVNVVWQEYLLKDLATNEYLYLSEYNGHWMLAEKISARDFEHADMVNMQSGKSVLYAETTYALWHTYKATYQHVEGEFPYHPTEEYNVPCREYIAPPYLLASEKFGSTYEYSRAKYVSRKALRKAFKPAQAMPYLNGIGATQVFAPWVDTGDFMKIAIIFSIFILVVQYFYQQQARQQEVLSFFVPVNDSTVGKPILSPSFTLAGGTANLSVQSYAVVSNAWAEVGVDMVNEQTGKERSWASGVEYYSGVDEGERWSEGSYGNTELICSVEPGAYHLVVTPEKDAALQGTEMSLTLTQDVPTWWNAIWAVLIMCGTSGALIFLERSFERRRWYNSDYSPYDSHHG